MNNAIEYESELIGKDIDNPLNENYYIPTEGFHTDGSIGHWHNKKRNESTKMKIKLSMIGQHDGKNNPMYGKKHTQSSIEKIKKSQIGKKHTQHSIQKMRESALKLNNKRGLSQNAIVVEHIPTGMIFDCILDAADYFSISRGTIRRHINNNVQLVGIKWRRIN